MIDEARASERPEDETEDDYALRDRVVAAAVEASKSGERALLEEVLEPLHPADIADLLEQVEPEDRTAILKLAGDYIDGEILSEIDEDIRDDVIEALEPEVLAEAVRELESDDVVDLIEGLEPDQQESIIGALDVVDRIAVEQALSYPESSAGRLMQREVVIAPEHWSVGDAIDHLRAHGDLPEQFYHVILVDPRHRPSAYVTLGRLMSSRRDVKLADIVEDSFRTFDVTEDEGDVAYAFNQYHLISAPVVDEDGRLAGIITIDDAMGILDEEHEEDVLRLGGVGDESLSNSSLEIVRRRFPWLAVNLGTAILASLVISLFEDALSAVVALAVLMPIVASMGGNAGTQSMTVAVRAIATRDLTAANALRVVRREGAAGLMNGAIFAIVMGVVGIVWFGEPMIGAVIAAAMVINLVIAALSGILIPITLDKIGVDPALASGTFVTTMTDVVGFFAFLGLATVVLL